MNHQVHPDIPSSIPQIFVWGCCFDSVSRSRPVLPAPPPPHTTLSHSFFHTQLSHTPSFTHFCHTVSFLRKFVTHHLSTQLCHTQLCHTPSFTQNSVINIFFEQLCVAGVALRDLHIRFTWQAWRLETSTCVSLHVAGVALDDIHLFFAFQAWHLWHWAVPGGTLGRRLGSVDAAALCVASVGLGNIHRRFAWQAWHLWNWADTGGVHGRRLGTVGRAVTPRHFA